MPRFRPDGTVPRTFDVRVDLARAFKIQCADLGLSQRYATELLMSYFVAGHLTPTQIAFHNGRTDIEQLEAALRLLKGPKS